MTIQRLQPWDDITAEFLNHLYDGREAFDTIKGVQEEGRHRDPVVETGRTKFIVNTEVMIPPYSVFKVLEPLPDSYSEQPKPRASQEGESTLPSPLYTNGANLFGADSGIYPYLLQANRLYRLSTDTTNPPAVGDTAQPKSGTWTVEKGGNEFLCMEDPDADNLAWYLKLPAGGGSGAQRVGFVITNDIEARSPGEIELYDMDDIPNGVIVPVYNPHDVTFYKENTISGEEAPADRVIVFEVAGWDPVIFPFMLSACESIDPTFEPTYA